jgi:hypothetical protein
MSQYNEAYKASLRQAQWEAEQNRPYELRDKLTIGASVVGIFTCLAIVILGRLYGF